ncbi:MAG: S-adenosyl-L-methionine-dependent methyltransferase, partial [Olpidium bornovanus]
RILRAGSVGEWAHRRSPSQRPRGERHPAANGSALHPHAPLPGSGESAREAGARRCCLPRERKKKGWQIWARSPKTYAMSIVRSWLELILDTGYVPDFILRRGIRYLNRKRLAELDYRRDLTAAQEKKMVYIEGLKKRPIAEHTEKANEQHYEVATGFFHLHLGARMKYSSCLYPEGLATGELNKAEDHMLELYTVRAQLEDGMDILDLGCGWGSLCLYLCEARFRRGGGISLARLACRRARHGREMSKYPNCKISALSNSNGQREYIEGVAKAKGFKNLTVYTGDVKDFQFEKQGRFDRVLSIEMFEHMKNYEFLLAKIAGWLKPGGMLFVHIFVHRQQPYDFVADESWMAKHFFTGGTMPAFDTLSYFQRDLWLRKAWYVSGENYGKTSEAWLARLDAARDGALRFLEATYGGPEQAEIWFRRWRIFYLAVAELFSHNRGQEWGVGHYLFEKKAAVANAA